MLRIAAASPEASQWSAGTYDALLHDPGKGEVWVAQSLEDLAGFASFRVIGKEAELLNLAVRPENRRFGYGKILLQQVCDEAARLHAERLFLEVRESNQPAVSLYERFGFRTVGRRPGYYPGLPPSPPEDAVVLVRDLFPISVERPLE